MLNQKSANKRANRLEVAISERNIYLKNGVQKHNQLLPSLRCNNKLQL